MCFFSHSCMATNLFMMLCAVLQLSRVTYKDPRNQVVVNRLILEVKALNPEFLTQHIKGKAKRKS